MEMEKEIGSREEIFKELRKEFKVLDGEAILIHIMYDYYQKLYSGEERIESITFCEFPYFFSRYNDMLIKSLLLFLRRISESSYNGKNLTIDYFVEELKTMAAKDEDEDFKEKVENLNCICKEIRDFTSKPELKKEINKFIAHIDRKACMSEEERSLLFDEGSEKNVLENIEEFMRNLAIILTEGEDAIVDSPSRYIIEKELDDFISALEQGVKYIEFARNNSISLDCSTIEENLLKSGKKIVDIET